MKTYKLYTYDVWGNKVDGFQVNDVFRTDEQYELNPADSDQDWIKSLKRQGLFRKGLHCKSIEVDQGSDPDHTIYLIDVRKKSGYHKPLCELRCEQ